MTPIIRTPKFRDQVEAQGSTNYAAIRPADVLSYTMPLPPLDEQRRIVARIAEMAGRIEQARGLRREAMAEAGALLTSSIMGQTWRFEIDGTLGQALKGTPRNGWSPRCGSEPGGIAVLSLSAVTGYRYRAEGYKTTIELTRPDAHYWLKPGDLLMTRSNTPDLVGHAAIFNGQPFPCIYPDLMMRLDVNEDLANKRFVHWWLRGATARDFIAANAKGTSPTMRKISQDTVMRIPFPIGLSPDVQRQAADALDELQRLVDTLTSVQATTAAEMDALLPSVLDRAFRGEL